MEMHANVWGHVALETPATLAMQESEEASEMEMFRCRYRKRNPLKISLGGFLPATDRVIFNPNTLQDIATIFEIDIEKAFA